MSKLLRLLMLRRKMRDEGYLAFAIEPPIFSHRPIMRVAQDIKDSRGETSFWRMLRVSGMMGSSMSVRGLWCEVNLPQDFCGLHILADTVEARTAANIIATKRGRV